MVGAEVSPVLRRRTSRRAGERLTRSRENRKRFHGNRWIQPLSRRRGLGLAVLYISVQLYLLPAAIAVTAFVLALVGWQSMKLARGQGWVSVLEFFPNPWKFLLQQPVVEFYLSIPNLDRTLRLLAASLTFGLTLVGNLIFARRQKGIDPRRLGFRWPSPFWRIVVVGIVGVALNPLSIVPWAIINHVILFPPHQATAQSLSVADVASYVPYYLLLAGAEELIFRGYVLQVLERSWGTVVGLFGSAFLFSLAHFGPLGVTTLIAVQHFAFGILLAYLFLLSRNLWLTTTFHAAWNVGVYVTGSVLLTMESSSRSPVVFKLTESNRALLEIGTILLATIGCQLLFKRRIAWSDIARAFRSHDSLYRRSSLVESAPARP
jgi:membrane protease YdiL (CAAX protease family)